MLEFKLWNNKAKTENMKGAIRWWDLPRRVTNTLTHGHSFNSFIVYSFLLSLLGGNTFSKTLPGVLGNFLLPGHNDKNLRKSFA